ncbi:general secretion pathway protein E [Oceanisphaera litoralis]|uniref:type II secretion system ATPase GspE n=1 Tax=Oceanisphaera litoralis TaxID=225144 RepID=UPI0019563F8B|nr:type II secretion system ATPase GspE [Oceanisphaera litoralis]MBM7456039.1 general secretion pathway protein E [Oceanisphaera litoralis]
MDPEGALAAVADTRLGQTLIEQGHISDKELARLERMRQRQADGGSLTALLLNLGMISERDLATCLSDLTRLPLTAVEEYPLAPPLERPLPYRFLKEHHLVPLRQDNDELVLAMVDPRDDFSVRAMAMMCQQPIRLQVGVSSEITSTIERLYGEGQSKMGDILSAVQQEEETEESIAQLKDLASEAPVIRLVNLIIQKAVDLRASDIHVEPFENRLNIRYRIDGVLQQTEAPPVNMTPAITSRIKIMARLNIAERRLPQDGRIELKIQGQELDVRVSTVPTMHGESLVMRLLNRESVILDFDALGFAKATKRRLQQVLKIPHGMVMVTGPTGSGKTTTLYTALNQLNTTELKLITVEDPVEYQLEGVNQIHVKPAIGLTFASALRSIVRQDPDVIMVGEMRDLETARICVQSALTGHLVLSTLHTNDAASSVTRLLEMGVEDYLLTSTLNGVIGQRLVRVLCPHCKEDHEPLPELVRELKLSPLEPGQPIRLHRPVGCAHCAGTGYHGRLAIQELLTMNDDIRKLVLSHADAGKIQQAAIRNGMITMYGDGLLKAQQGITNVEEVIRVTQET